MLTRRVSNFTAYMCFTIKPFLMKTENNLNKEKCQNLLNFLSFKEPKKKMFLKIAAQLSEAGDFLNP